MKIIFCTDGIFPHNIGGMQRHSRILIEHLAKVKNIELIVLHPHNEKVFSPNLNIKEIFIETPNSKNNYLLECYRYSKRVYNVIKQYPDAIIYSQGLSVWYKINTVKNRLVVNPHGLEPFQTIGFKEKLINFPFRTFFRYIFNNSAIVISLGGMLTAILQKQLKNSFTKIKVIPNGVEKNQPKKQKHFNSCPLNLLFVARFTQNKGIHILLQAIKELNDEGWENKLKFILGGKGPLFQHYSTNHKYKNVNYLGFISDEELIAFYRTSDLFVFPTLFEGMPTVILEAMSFGLPIIVSNVGATAELVDGSNGYLIRKNNVQDLKNAIINFYNLTEVSKNKLSESSIQKIENTYDWEIVTKRYLEVFEMLNPLR